MLKPNNSLAAEKLAVAIEKIRRLTERAQTAEQLLRDLTPGGSDLQDPARCAARLRAESTELHRLVVEATARAGAAEAEIKRLQDATCRDLQQECERLRLREVMEDAR